MPMYSSSGVQLAMTDDQIALFVQPHAQQGVASTLDKGRGWLVARAIGDTSMRVNAGGTSLTFRLRVH
jgi:hypothetical protein